MIVLDTNVLSDLVRPKPKVDLANWMSTKAQEELAISVITEAELRLGVLRAPDGRRRMMYAVWLDQILQEFADRVLPVDRATARACAEITARRQMLGRPIQLADALIAATCKAHGALLATRNLRDFTECEIGLVDPFSA